MYTAEEIAGWFLTKDSISPKKLQKLVYYAYAWYLTFYNDVEKGVENRLFKNRIEAWVHGPVVPEIYEKYKDNGYHEIPQKENEVTLDEQTIDVLDQVWDVYGEYNGNELESITHQELPWQEAREGYGPLDRCNKPISNQTIFEYYTKRLV